MMVPLNPKHNKTSIPYSQALRLRRICSEESDFHNRVHELKNHLLERGYRDHLIKPAIQLAASKPRVDCLKTKKKALNNSRIPLVLTYHPHLSTIRSIVKRHHHLLQLSDKMVIPDPPILAFRRPKNLRDLLVRAELTRPTPVIPGNTPCGRPRCKTCPRLLQRDFFICRSTNKKIKIHCQATCKTSNLIYLIECKKCGLQYVGETEQALHERMNGHRADILHKRTERPVALHFNSVGHSEKDLQVMVIEQMHRNDSVLRKIRENMWITTIGSSHPSGMNLKTVYEFNHLTPDL